MTGVELPALLTAGVAILGWFATSHLARRREEEKRRTDSTIKYLERQIEEFYGPLFSVLHQIFVAYDVQSRIVQGLRGWEDQQRAAQEESKVVQFFQKHYFIPLHEEMKLILKSKLYLMQGSEMPTSLYKYLRHSIQERAQFELWNEMGVDTSFVKGLPYPSNLYEELKASLEDLLRRYEVLTRGSLL
jgi:hypothetical protein